MTDLIRMAEFLADCQPHRIDEINTEVYKLCKVGAPAARSRIADLRNKWGWTIPRGRPDKDNPKLTWYQVEAVGIMPKKGVGCAAPTTMPAKPPQLPQDAPEAEKGGMIPTGQTNDCSDISPVQPQAGGITREPVADGGMAAGNPILPPAPFS